MIHRYQTLAQATLLVWVLAVYLKQAIHSIIIEPSIETMAFL
jgi:hypothetical protein